MNVKDETHNGRTALMHAACIKNNGAIIKLLCYHNPSSMEAKEEGGGGNTALHLAIIHDLKLEECIYIIEKSLNRATNAAGMNAFMLACFEDKEDVAIAIITQSPNIDMEQVDDEGRTALMLACESGFLKIVKIILAHADKELVNAKNNTKYTALMMACENKHNTCALALLNFKDVDIEACADTPDFEVYGKRDMSKEVRDGILPPDVNQGENALMLACGLFDDDEMDECADMADVVSKLVRMKCNLNTKRNGMTALMIASDEGNLEVVQALWSADHKLKCDGTQMTAMRMAIKNNNKDIVLHLLTYRLSKDGPLIDINAKDDSGKTDIMYAVGLENRMKIVTLMKRYVDTTARDNKNKNMDDYLKLQDDREPTERKQKTTSKKDATGQKKHKGN